MLYSIAVSMAVLIHVAASLLEEMQFEDDHERSRGVYVTIMYMYEHV